MEQPVDLRTFRTRVYLVARQVPPGRVTSYGQIAAMIPPPVAVDPSHYARIRAQWVGRAMRHAPADVPWHRVINSRGRISLPPGSRSAAIQRMRLEAEGVALDRSGQVDLAQYGWEGPADTWLDEHGLLPAQPLVKSDSVQLKLFP